jgi:hypothetical protein
MCGLIIALSRSRRPAKKRVTENNHSPDNLLPLVVFQTRRAYVFARKAAGSASDSSGISYGPSAGCSFIRPGLCFGLIHGLVDIALNHSVGTGSAVGMMTAKH